MRSMGKTLVIPTTPAMPPTINLAPSGTFCSSAAARGGGLLAALSSWLLLCCEAGAHVGCLGCL
jgi:hypothetical protein